MPNTTTASADARAAGSRRAAVRAASSARSAGEYGAGALAPANGVARCPGSPCTALASRYSAGAALRYRLGEGGQTPPAYGCVVLDEGFVKADSDYTGRALRALQELGFQLIIGAPREKATAFEDFVDLVAYISADPDNPNGVRIYSMTIQEALQLDQGAA